MLFIFIYFYTITVKQCPPFALMLQCGKGSATGNFFCKSALDFLYDFVVVLPYSTRSAAFKRSRRSVESERMCWLEGKLSFPPRDIPLGLLLLIFRPEKSSLKF